MSNDAVETPDPEAVSSPAAQPIEFEWRRMHPLSPLLRGGLFLIVIAGIIVTNLRDRVFELFFDKKVVDAMGPNEGDLIDYLATQKLLIWALVALFIVITIIVGISWLSWRFSTFRITADAVESKRGVLFRQHRRAPLERIQSVNLQRSLLARLVGLTEVDVQTGGQGGKVALQYLGHREAKEVREQILLASRVSKAGGMPAAARTGLVAGAVTVGGASDWTGSDLGSNSRNNAGYETATGTGTEVVAEPGAAALGETEYEMQAGTLPAMAAAENHAAPIAVDFAGQAYAVVPGVLDNRLRDLADFDIDPSARETGNLIKVPVGRLIASILLGSEMMVLLIVVAVIIGMSIWATPFALAGLFPTALILVSILVSQFNKGFNFALSRAEDGVRIGAGLTATTTETIPFGRVHAVEALQPLGWRLLGWWKVRITTAGHSASQAGQNKMQNIVLPVGEIDDVLRVFETLLHTGGVGAEDRRAALRDALEGTGEGFVRPGHRAAVLLWLGTRRAGLRIEEPLENHATLRIRRGWLTRSLSDMPIVRAQSVQLSRPLVHHWLGLASVQAHTVLGPVRMYMRGIGLAQARQVFDELSETVVRVQGADAALRASGDVGAPARSASESPGKHLVEPLSMFPGEPLSMFPGKHLVEPPSVSPGEPPVGSTGEAMRGNE